jgi:hypothetical protein
VAVLGLLPPAVFLTPDMAKTAGTVPMAVSRPDMAPHDDKPHTCRCGARISHLTN